MRKNIFMLELVILITLFILGLFTGFFIGKFWFLRKLNNIIKLNHKKTDDLIFYLLLRDELKIVVSEGINKNTIMKLIKINTKKLRFLEQELEYYLRNKLIDENNLENNQRTI